MIKEYKDHSDFEKAQWGSHKEVIIDNIMKKEKIDFLLELGSGEFSTPIYAPLVTTLVSVETNSEWYEYMRSKHPASNVEYKLISDKEIPEFIDSLVKIKVPNLVLVDHTHDIPDQRATVANQLMQHKIKYIVIHDICQSIIDKIENNDSYEYFVNSKSINPSLLLSRK